MDDTRLGSLWTWLETLPLSEHIAISWWFPLLESIHVVAITFLVGVVLSLDLKLLGWSFLQGPPARVLGELNAWAWGAFVLSVPTGFGMFMTRAGHYAGNPAFRIKLILLALAGVNLMLFQRRGFRKIGSWESAERPPASVRRAAGLSLLLWAGIVLAGRWIGHS